MKDKVKEYDEPKFANPSNFIILFSMWVSFLTILSYGLYSKRLISESITLFAALSAVTGILYSNYKSDLRTVKQLKQQEKNIKMELRFNKKEDLELKIFKLLDENSDCFIYDFLISNSIKKLIDHEIGFNDLNNREKNEIQKIIDKRKIIVNELLTLYKEKYIFYLEAETFEFFESLHSKINTHMIRSISRKEIRTYLTNEKYSDLLGYGFYKLYTLLHKDLGINTDIEINDMGFGHSSLEMLHDFKQNKN
jgi:hypothetical protein